MRWLCVIAFLVGNVGLTQIIVAGHSYLMFLYPLAITLILSFFCPGFVWPKQAAVPLAHGAGRNRCLWGRLSALPQAWPILLVLQILGYYKILPLFSLGMGWVVPTFVALLAGHYQREAGGRPGVILRSFGEKCIIVR